MLCQGAELTVLVFEALNQAKEQEANVLSRHRNLLFWFVKSETK